MLTSLNQILVKYNKDTINSYGFAFDYSKNIPLKFITQAEKNINRGNSVIEIDKYLN